jgi:hypothetical protein
MTSFPAATPILLGGVIEADMYVRPWAKVNQWIYCREGTNVRPHTARPEGWVQKTKVSEGATEKPGVTTTCRLYPVTRRVEEGAYAYVPGRQAAT